MHWRETSIYTTQRVGSDGQEGGSYEYVRRHWYGYGSSLGQGVRVEDCIDFELKTCHGLPCTVAVVKFEFLGK